MNTSRSKIMPGSGPHDLGLPPGDLASRFAGLASQPEPPQRTERGPTVAWAGAAAKVEAATRCTSCNVTARILSR